MFKEAETVAALVKATKHKTRIRILKYLGGNPQSTVTSIFKALRLGNAECSMHLAVLRKAGLVSTAKSERSHKEVLYSLNEPYLSEVDNLFTGIAKISKK